MDMQQGDPPEDSPPTPPQLPDETQEVEYKQLRVFVLEEPGHAKVCNLKVPAGAIWLDLSAAVSDVVLGPEEARWIKVKEVRNEDLDPNTGGGTITVHSSWKAPSLQLWTQPHENSCPLSLSHVASLLALVPAPLDLYRLLDPQHSPAEQLESQQALSGWWADMQPKKRSLLRLRTLQRLVSKVTLPEHITVLETHGEGEEEYQIQVKHDLPLQLREPIISEGVQGLWELCGDRGWATRLDSNCLQALIDTLNGQLPRPMELAARAVWCLVAMAGPRTALVKLGGVAALNSAAWFAIKLRTQLAEAANAPAAVSAAPSELGLHQGAESEAGMTEEKSRWSSESTTTVSRGGAMSASHANNDAPAVSGADVQQAEAALAAAAGATLETLNRIVYSCLGSLSLLAVDARAREASLQVSPSLELLSQVAKLDFMVPEPVLPPSQSLRSMSRISSQQGEQQADLAVVQDAHVSPEGSADHQELTSGAVAHKCDSSKAAGEDKDASGAAPGECEQDGREVHPSVVMTQHSEEDGLGMRSAFFTSAAAGSETGHAGHGLPALSPEDDPHVHQQMAAEALWAMMGRDGVVRASMCKHGAVPHLIALMHSSNPGVSAPAVLCLAALARDTEGVAQAPPAATSGSAAQQQQAEDAASQPAAAAAASAHIAETLVGMLSTTIGTLPGSAHPDAQPQQAQYGGDGQQHEDQHNATIHRLKSHAGIQLMCSSGESLLLVTELMHHVEDLLTSYSNGRAVLTSDHTTLTVLAAACTALWGAVCAQLLHESLPSPPPPSPPPPDPEALKWPFKKQQETPPPPPPKPQLLHWGHVSDLSRVAGQLIALLHTALQQEEQQQQAQKPQGAPSGQAGLSAQASRISHWSDHTHHTSQTHHTHHTRHTNDQRSRRGSTNTLNSDARCQGHDSPDAGRCSDSTHLAASLCCTMSCLAAIQASPLMLARITQQLQQAQETVHTARQQEGDCHGLLSLHMEDVKLRRTTSKAFSYWEEDEAETERLEGMVKDSEVLVDRLLQQQHELEDTLQAACEECAAAAQDALRCLPPVSKHMGAVHLASAAVLAGMAQAKHPLSQPTVDDPSSVFKGPLRPLLMEAGVLPDLLALARSTCCEDYSAELAQPTRLVVATGVAHLVASQEVLPAHYLAAVVDYLGDEQQPRVAQPHLAASMWCLAREEEHRKGLLAEGSWAGLLRSWLHTGLRAARHQHTLAHNFEGFFVPEVAQAATTGSMSSAASHAESHLFTAGMAAEEGSVAETETQAAAVQVEDGLMDVIISRPYDEELARLPPTVNPMADIQQVRFCIMSSWLLLRQWLVDNMSPMNTLTTSDGLHVRSNTSWWALKFSIDTPLTLTPAALQALTLLAHTAMALPSSEGSPCAPLCEMCLRCCWNLSATHPVVASQLVALGLPELLMNTAANPGTGSSLVRTALAYIMQLAASKQTVNTLGGVLQVARLLCRLVERALQGCSTQSTLSHPAGRGADVILMEDATRGLARLGLSQEGRAALKAVKAVRVLVAVLRLDNMALESVLTRRRAAGVPDWVRKEELICPLRAINNLAITLTGQQAVSAQQIADAALAAHNKAHGHSGSSTPKGSTCATPEPHRGSPTAGNVHANSQVARTSNPGSAHQGVATSGANQQVSNSCGARQSGTGQKGPASKGVPGEHYTIAVHPGGDSCSENCHSHDHDHDSNAPCEDAPACGDAEVGLLSLWALLNVSGYLPVQVAICKHGLYSLLRAVHRAVDPLRSSTAAAILANIHYHPDNATTLYKAELKLKHAALLRLQQQGLFGGSSPRQKGAADRPATAMTRKSGPRGSDSSGGLLSTRPSTAHGTRPGTAHSTHHAANLQLPAGQVHAGELMSLAMIGNHRAPSMTRQATMARSVTMARGTTFKAQQSMYRGDLKGLSMHKRDNGSRPGTAAPSVVMDGRVTPATLLLANNGITDSMAVLHQYDQGGDSPLRPASPSTTNRGVCHEPGCNEEAGDDAESDDLEAQRAYQEVRLSFLQWVVDPSAQAFAALEELQQTGSHAGMSQDVLMTRLTHDPEELTWLQEAQALNSSDMRYTQGSYLRGKFTRSLAEGAASLWNRAETGSPREGHPGTPAKSCIANSCTANRPCTAPAQYRPSSPACATFDTPWMPAGKTTQHALGRGGNAKAHSQRSLPANRLRAREAWRPHVLAFVQDAVLHQPQVYLAQRLLSAGASPDVVDNMTTLAVKLFGNQVLTEGIKAMEEREAAEAAFRAAVAQAAQEEKERMEEEARVLDTVRWDTADNAFKAPRGTLSRSMSMAVARSFKRGQSRATSRAVSRAVSRRVSCAMSNASDELNDAASRPAAASLQRSNQVAVKDEGSVAASRARAPRAAAAGGVRFGGDVSTKTSIHQTGGGEHGETDAALVAAATALLRSTGHDVAGQSQHPAELAADEARKSASFVASSLVQPGSLTSLAVPPNKPTALNKSSSGKGRRSSRGSLRGTRSGAASLRQSSSQIQLPSDSPLQRSTQVGRSHLTTRDMDQAHAQYRLISRANTLMGKDAQLNTSLDQNARKDAESKWLGEDVKHALAQPDNAQHQPHTGRVSPPDLPIAKIKSQAYFELQDMLYPEKAKIPRPVQLDESVPRPVTELKAQVEDVITLGALKEAVDAAVGFNKEAIQQELVTAETVVSTSLPLSVKVATGDGGPHKVYRFPRDILYDPRHMMMWQHVEGASYCQSLYGHYLLPNGKLAHFVLGDTVRKGHQVDLEPAPEVPFSPADWLAEGLPTTTTWADWALPMQGHIRALQLLAPLWCPVPALGKPPTDSVLEWEGGVRGGTLALTSICLSATLTTVEKDEVEVITVEPTIKHKKKKAAPGADAAAASSGRATGAAAGRQGVGVGVAVPGRVNR